MCPTWTHFLISPDSLPLILLAAPTILSHQIHYGLAAAVVSNIDLIAPHKDGGINFAQEPAVHIIHVIGFKWDLLIPDPLPLFRGILLEGRIGDIPIKLPAEFSASDPFKIRFDIVCTPLEPKELGVLDGPP